MRPAKTLTVMFLAVSSAAFGQAPGTTPAASNGKPQVTTFLHQTLGESWEDFMRITGTKMNACGSQEPQAEQWCESFKKIEAGGQADISVGKSDIAVSLVFSQKRLMQVLVHGKADFSKSLAELTQQYGTSDAQTANTAVWSFPDGGGITAIVKPGNEVVVVYYCKDAKEAVEQVLAPPPPPALVGQPVPTDFRGFVLGATIDDIINAGIFNESVCVNPKGDTKRACKELERVKAGQVVGLQILNDKSGRVTLCFEGRKLLEIRVDPSISTSFAEQVSLLSQKYGKPTALETHTEANALGARWECGDAVWRMPDGAVISAHEFIEMLPYSGPTRVVMVNFKNAERLQKERTAQQAQTMKY